MSNLYADSTIPLINNNLRVIFMAIQPCKECGGPVSDKAESCPMCGAKQPKKTSPVVIFLAVLLALGGLIALMTPKSEPVERENKPLTEEDIMSARQMQAYMAIKSSMKDPDSAKINFFKGKPCGQVNAKNSFGAYTGFKRIVLLKDINIEGQGLSNSQFEQIWKKHCEGVNF